MIEMGVAAAVGRSHYRIHRRTPTF
jgi:hypothetical protein